MSPLLEAELIAPTPALGRAWQRIARHCARDVAQRVRVRLRVDPAATPMLTLQLPAALAAAQHPVWCLACRLACLLPEVRVSVLVTAQFEATRATATTAAKVDAA